MCLCEKFLSCFLFFFFFQAEDGIRDRNVTGVQTCALPICWRRVHAGASNGWADDVHARWQAVCRRVDCWRELLGGARGVQVAWIGGFMLRFLLPALLLVPSGVLDAQSRNLEIYWIDVEGGAATLIVSPSGE